MSARQASQTAEYALTIKQPWLWLILHGPKYTENRSWAPPKNLVGSRIWLHAGKSIDQDGIDFITAQGIELPKNFETGAILGSAIIADVVTEHDDPWFFGPYGWVLEDIQILDQPIPCQGKQKLWRFSDEGDTEMSKGQRTAQSKYKQEILDYLKNNKEGSDDIKKYARLSLINSLAAYADSLNGIFLSRAPVEEIIRRANNLIETIDARLDALARVTKDDLELIADIYGYYLQAEGKKFQGATKMATKDRVKKIRKAVPLLKNIQERAQFLHSFAQQLEIAAREMEQGEVQDLDELLDSLEIVEDVLESATEEMDHAVDRFAI